jgi:RimJ/RimL family protein N-acetyltransferase
MSETAQDLAAFDRVSWPAHTLRLAIRPATPDDLPRLYEIRVLPEVTRWLTGSPASFEDYVERYGTPERLASTLVMQVGGVIVGDLFLTVESPWAQAEVREQARHTLAAVGWCVDPAYSGQGYATEGAGELLRICFEELGVRRVVAGAFADNVASVRVMVKIGMRVEGRGVLDSLHRELGWLDGVTAAVLAEEWQATRR